MTKVSCCDNHKRYTAGCVDCLTRSRDSRSHTKGRTEDTHYKNGKPKAQGLYSQKNWDRFNAIGKASEKP